MEHRFSFDRQIVGAMAILLVVSLVMLYSISASEKIFAGYVWRQALFVGIGSLVFLFFATMDYRVLRTVVRPLYFGMALGLGAVLFFGTKVNGTVGWIMIGPFSLQLVEFVKCGVIIFLASFITSKQSVFGPWMRVIVSCFLIMGLVALVLLQPDFGSAMVVLALWCGMLFVSGIPKKNLFILLILFVCAGIGTWFTLAEYQKARIAVFIDPQSDPRGSGYNVIQAITAVGNGGVGGQGLGHGTQTQLQFLPERQTDFIFAAIAEELGLVGALFVLCLFGIIFIRLYAIAMHTPDNFGYLLVVGTLVMFAVETIINVGMNVGLMPVTGIPLPFVSYGGSSLVSSMMSMGIAVSVERWTRLRQII